MSASGTVVLLVGGRPAARQSADAVAAVLRGRGHDVHTMRSASAEECAAGAGRVAADGAGTLVALGGDGLVNIALHACAGTSTRLGIIPAGTGNDLARTIRMPLEPLAAARALADGLATGAVRRLDLGKVGERYFGTVLCAGFDARVNVRANAMRWPRGPRRYDLAIVAELFGLRTRTLRVRAGEDELELRATMVAVGNTRSYGGGIPICPHADATDGLLDVTIVGECGRAELLRMLPTLRTGRHVEHRAVRTLRADRVSLTADGWFAYADGEPQGDLPLTVTAAPGAVTVVSPAADPPTV